MIERAEIQRTQGGGPLAVAPRSWEHGLSVIVPAHNEADSIVDVMRRILATLEQIGEPFELIVVEDGSTDETAEVLVRADLPLVLLRNDRNRGYGASIKRGIRQARYDRIMITDADGTYPESAFPDLVRGLEDADMVVGCRTGANVAIPLVRRPAKWAIRSLAVYLVGHPIPDLNSGLRAMRRESVERFVRLLPDGFSLTTTITLAMLSNQLDVRYHVIDYAKRAGRSKIRPIRDTLGFIQLIVRTVLLFNPLRVFLPLSVVFGLASLGVLFGSYFLTGKVMDVTTTVLFTTSVQLLAIGFLADLILHRTGPL
jgi:glycosyltransferase involved in cell wall biosynthesis